MSQNGADDEQSLSALQPSPAAASGMQIPGIRAVPVATFTQRELLSQGRIPLQGDAAALVPSAVQIETFELVVSQWKFVAQTSPTSLHCLVPATVVAVAHRLAFWSQMIDPLVVPAQSNWVEQVPSSCFTVPWKTYWHARLMLAIVDGVIGLELP